LSDCIYMYRIKKSVYFFFLNEFYFQFHFLSFSLSCTWEGMVISRWRTGQFVQGRSCRLNEILSFTLHYSINWIYTETDRGIVHLMHKRVDPKIHRNSHINHSKWSKQTEYTCSTHLWVSYFLWSNFIEKKYIMVKFENVKLAIFLVKKTYSVFCFM
jgi:hypothetical protein